MHQHHHSAKWRTWAIGSSLILTSYFIALAFPGKKDLRYVNTESMLSSGNHSKHLKWEDFAAEGATACTSEGSTEGEGFGALRTILSSKLPAVIVGYGVPLVVKGKMVVQLLLVPNDQFCVHVPPPPPHLMIQVEVPDGLLSLRDLEYPLEVKGVPVCDSKHMTFGTAKFSILAQSVQCIGC